MTSKQTPSQTIGPFFAYGLTPGQYGYEFADLANGDLLAQSPDESGTRIEITGKVFDGEGQVIGDAMIEIWQADSQGRYAHPGDTRPSNTGFRGFGRFGTGTEDDSSFRFRTVKPGSVDGEQAPHINVVVFARGMLSHAYTRIYFADELSANAKDRVLTSVPEDRRATLLATADDSSAPNTYSFDIHLQGTKETVFFEV
ncbi:MAG: protocatechuate 3,4-dioxygenase subunit alpha [Pseudomonadota bacterium]